MSGLSRNQTKTETGMIRNFLERKDEELRDKVLNIYYELKDSKNSRNKRIYEWASHFLDKHFSHNKFPSQAVGEEMYSARLNKSTSTSNLISRSSVSMQALVTTKKLKWYDKVLKVARVKKYTETFEYM